MGVNVPNFGPGTEPGVLRRWAQTVEGLGFDLLMISDRIAVTPDVAEQYPAPFYDQVLDDLAQLRLLGAGTVVLDPFNGDPGETHRPEVAWQALATVSAGARHIVE
jgi:hypothetical protein